MVDEPPAGSVQPDAPSPARPPPPVGWEPPAAPTPKEVAPGLIFASTPRRFLGYVIDSLLIGVAGYLIALVFIEATRSRPDSLVATWSSTIASVAISLPYFVWGWRTRARGTPGMRLLKLQVGNAADGRTLSLDQAIRRWFALGEVLGLLLLIPAMLEVASILTVVYALILLVTTISSPTKQGLHDRFARTMVVEPAGVGTTAVVVGCLAIVVIVLILPIVALLFLGAELSTMLSAVGSPAP